MKEIFFILFCLFSCNLFAQKANVIDTLDNDKVIKMVKSGLSDILIKKSIENSKAWKFDLSSDGLIKLKQAKVSDSLVVKMFEKDQNVQTETANSNNPNQAVNNEIKTNTNYSSLETLSPGIYWENNKKGKLQYIKLNSTTASYIRKTDFILGITSKGYYSISGKSALIKVNESQPTFYLVVGTSGNLNFEPSRFIVLASEIKKGNRLVTAYSGIVGTGELNNTSFNKKAGVIFPTYTRISNTLYKVTFEKKFPDGNYFFGPSQYRVGSYQDFLEFDITK